VLSGDTSRVLVPLKPSEKHVPNQDLDLAKAVCFAPCTLLNRRSRVQLVGDEIGLHSPELLGVIRHQAPPPRPTAVLNWRYVALSSTIELDLSRISITQTSRMDGWCCARLLVFAQYPVAGCSLPINDPFR
jgi:hypothetical protein